MSTMSDIRNRNLNKVTGNAVSQGTQAIYSLKQSLLSAIKVGCKLHKNNEGDVEFMVKLQSDLDSALTGMEEITSLIDDLTILRSNSDHANNLISKHSIDLVEFDKQLSSN